MFYGIISAKDNQTSISYFKSKKVSQTNVVPVNRLEALVSALKEGDVVYVVSVNRFPSVYMFHVFADAVLKRGASLKILEQGYLDIGNGKHYKASIRSYLQTLAELEG